MTTPNANLPLSVSTEKCFPDRVNKPHYRLKVTIGDSDLSLNIKRDATTGKPLTDTNNNLQPDPDYNNIKGFWTTLTANPACDSQSKVFNTLLGSLFSSFGVNIDDRLVGINANTDNATNPSYINMEVILNNNLKSNSNFPNNQLPAKCIAKWFFKWFKIFDNNKQDTWPINWPINNPPPECPSNFTSDVTIENYMNTSPNLLLNFKFNNVELYNGDTQIESYTNVNSAADPNSILDYIFMYSVVFSFLGAIAYTMLSVLQINPNDLIVNKNMVIAINVYFGLCGLLSFIAWYQFDTSYMYSGWLKRNFFNIDVIKLTNN